MEGREGDTEDREDGRLAIWRWLSWGSAEMATSAACLHRSFCLLGAGGRTPLTLSLPSPPVSVCPTESFGMCFSGRSGLLLSDGCRGFRGQGPPNIAGSLPFATMRRRRRGERRASGATPPRS